MKFARVLAWAIFLGASWTWCIGMYLPVLLVRDYGVWAWVVFAIPNVVGAAAMAWVLPDAEASRRLVSQHGTACKSFSAVTWAFHAFFVLSLAHIMTAGSDGPSWRWLMLAQPAVMLLFSGGDIFAAALTLAISIFCAAKLWSAGAIPRLPAAIPPGVDLLWISLVCVFGFIFCPYLDLTFHQARQATSPRQGRLAFGIGFGVVFFLMLLFSLSYTGWFTHPDFSLSILAACFVGRHFLFQSTLKLYLHGRALVPKRHLTSLLALVLCLIIPAAAIVLDRVDMSQRSFEFGYRCFMSFYGLVFPAYVWICIFGHGRKSVWLTAVLIAAPMYWMGFIERQMIWLAPGVAVVVLARFLPPKIPARNPA